MSGVYERPRSMWDALARRVSYTAGLVGGLVTAIIGPSPGAWRRSRRRLLGKREGSLIERSGGFAGLRASLIGSTKREVAAVIGPPQAGAVGLGSPTGSSAAVAQKGTDLWQADTWYYPFDPARQAAVAVQFHRGRVVRIEYIGGLNPGAPPSV